MYILRVDHVLITIHEFFNIDNNKKFVIKNCKNNQLYPKSVNIYLKFFNFLQFRLS